MYSDDQCFRGIIVLLDVTKQDAKRQRQAMKQVHRKQVRKFLPWTPYMNLKAWKECTKAVDDAKSEIERLDQLWSAVDKTVRSIS